MLEGTAGAILKYASAAFAHRLGVKDVCKYKDRTHRSMIQCYGRLYRDVSYIAATVICGVPAIRYDIVIRAIMWRKKKGRLLEEEKSLIIKAPSNPKVTWKISRLKLREQMHQRCLDKDTPSRDKNR